MLIEKIFPQMSSEFAVEEIANGNLTCPKITYELFSKYLDQFVEKEGFLAPAHKTNKSAW
mgnify:FL=1